MTELPLYYTQKPPYHVENPPVCMPVMVQRGEGRRRAPLASCACKMLPLMKINRRMDGGMGEQKSSSIIDETTWR